MSEEALALVNNLGAALPDPRVTAVFGTILDDALKKKTWKTRRRDWHLEG